MSKLQLHIDDNDWSSDNYQLRRCSAGGPAVEADTLEGCQIKFDRLHRSGQIYYVCLFLHELDA